MKKPIDPNLDNILDDILASESKASESVLPKKEQISEEIKNGVDYIVQYRQDDTAKAKASSIIKLGKSGEIKIIRE